jgi:hypothetical protein
MSCCGVLGRPIDAARMAPPDTRVAATATEGLAAPAAGTADQISECAPNSYTESSVPTAPPPFHIAQTTCVEVLDIPAWGSYAFSLDETAEKQSATGRKYHECQASAVCYLVNFLAAIPPTPENIQHVAEVSDCLNFLTLNYHHFNKRITFGEGKFDYIFCGQNFGEYACGLQDKFKDAFKGSFDVPRTDMIALEMTKALKEDPNAVIASRRPHSRIQQVLNRVLRGHWQGKCGAHPHPRWREALDQITQMKQTSTSFGTPMTAMPDSSAGMDVSGVGGADDVCGESSIAATPTPEAPAPVHSDNTPDDIYLVFVQDVGAMDSKTPAVHPVTAEFLRTHSPQQIVDALVDDASTLVRTEVYDVTTGSEAGSFRIQSRTTGINLVSPIHKSEVTTRVCHKNIIIQRA